MAIHLSAGTGYSIALLALGVLAICYGFFTPQLKFIWHCFLRPLGDLDHKSRLEKFYEGQAGVYDTTRHRLLRGRHTMLSLSAAHLKAIRAASPKKRLVWIDIGGGTGHNIEMMDKYFDIRQFDAIYIVDLCEPLLKVARDRVAKRGWTNVTVLCQDATALFLPEWTIRDPKGSVGFVTLSYSLSMIPDFYTLLDRIEYIVCPQDGLIGVVDFYTAGKQPSLHEKAIGGISKECGWLARWFWQIWFDFDHVSLSPARRSYLEYKFGTVKSYNGRNRFVLPFIVRIPYYIWLGRPRSCDVSKACHTFEVEGGNMIGNCSPIPFKVVGEVDAIPPLEIGERRQVESKSMVTIDITPPLSSFHYHIPNPWRLPYYEQPVHKDFRTFIYSFTWEDPLEDMNHLELTSNDSMLVVTSAGDNALHYAITAAPGRIHCVDMNPCQGHLLELKLAAIKSLKYEDFFALFGTGRHLEFRRLLDSTIAPYLSSIAYQFWRINGGSFTSPSSSFYLQGYSGWALRLAQVVFSLAGVTKYVKQMCESDKLEDQAWIWREKIRPVLLNPIVVRLLKSRIFCWNALGVPKHQRRMVLEGGGVYEYIRDTFEPLPEKYLFKTDNYFYRLALTGEYSSSCCPAYLTRAGFEVLKSDRLDSFRLHTDSIINVLHNLPDSTLTRAIIMDHLDWFEPEQPAEVESEVGELKRVIAAGGMVFWRSASRKPWYNAVFERAGFRVDAIIIREGGKAIDRVNMYASFWKGTRV